jgi:hypothetical protein
MIIWLASYPRSGNTFCWTLLKRVYGVQLVDYYQLSKSSASATPNSQAEMEAPQSLESMAAADSYYVLKTHEMPQEDYPALYLVRDGRDSLVSYAHYAMEYDRRIPKMFRGLLYGRTLRELILKEYFGGWSGNVQAWAKRSTPTAIIKFEELIVDPVGTLREGLRQLNYFPPEAENPKIPGFDALHQAHPNMYRKGQVGGWREEMPDKLHQLFWERHGAAMDLMGYSRD